MKEGKHGLAKAVGIGSGMIDMMAASVTPEQGRSFNDALVASGLIPDRIPDIMPITIQLGQWIGNHLLRGRPLNLAIAELDEVMGAPIDTLLSECKDVGERVRLIMLEGALRALSHCCEEGRVVEAATFIIQTTYAALEQEVAVATAPRTPD